MYFKSGCVRAGVACVAANDEAAASTTAHFRAVALVGVIWVSFLFEQAFEGGDRNGSAVPGIR